MKSMLQLAAATIFCLPIVSLAQSKNAAPEAQKAKQETAKTLSAEGLPPIWMQGKPVKSFEKGKLYIFEFWATWCVPCLQVMPHMEELHQAVKGRQDIAIIGVNVMDDTPSDRLMGFLKSKKLTPSYPMAADDGRKGPVSKHWLTPLNIRSIPHALAIRDGVLLWAGHPSQLNVSVLETLSDKNFKPGSALKDTEAELQAKRQKQTQEIRDAASRDPEAALQLLDKLAENGTLDDNEVMAGYETIFSTQIRYDRLDEARSTVRKMTAQFPKNRKALLNAGNWLVETEQLEGKDATYAIELADIALEMYAADVAAMEIKAAALYQLGDPAAAAILQEKALKSTKLNAEIRALRDEISK